MRKPHAHRQLDAILALCRRTIRWSKHNEFLRVQGRVEMAYEILEMVKERRHRRHGAVAAGLLMLAAGAVLGENVKLEWNPSPTDQEIKSYTLYWATNIIGPWVRMTNVTTTNAVVDVPIGQNFFYCTASNFWSESERSNIAWTPAAATKIEGLAVTRTPSK